MNATRERYWLKRELANSAKAHNFAEKKLAKLKREYQRAIKTIEQQINDFWEQYATEEGITVTEAKRKLSTSKVKPDLDEYFRLVKEINDPVAQAMLREMGKNIKLSRLEHLKLRIEKEVTRLFGIEQNTAKETLSEAYEFGYYRHIYEIQKSIGAGKDFEVLTPRAVDRAISTAWSGKNYSKRIWERRKLLAKKVEQIITQGVILGESNQKMAAKLSQAVQVSYSRAKTLIRTETNHVYNQATLKGYEATGADSYIFLATLDARTSEICQSLDGRKFKLKEAQVGKNYPPMHPNCRSTTIPDVSGAQEGTRIARFGGEKYKVPGDMTYGQWYNEYVVKRLLKAAEMDGGSTGGR